MILWIHASFIETWQDRPGNDQIILKCDSSISGIKSNKLNQDLGWNTWDWDSDYERASELLKSEFQVIEYGLSL